MVPPAARCCSRRCNSHSCPSPKSDTVNTISAAKRRLRWLFISIAYPNLTRSRRVCQDRIHPRRPRAGVCRLLALLDVGRADLLGVAPSAVSYSFSRHVYVLLICFSRRREHVRLRRAVFKSSRAKIRG